MRQIMWKVFLLLLIFDVYITASLNSSNYLTVNNYILSDDLLAFNSNSHNVFPILFHNTIDEPQKIRLMDDIKKGQSLAGFGTVLHFSGFIMSGIAIPLMMTKIKYKDDSDDFPYLGLSLSLAGVGLSLIGPIPSLKGANRIEYSMEYAYDDFKGHAYTGAYIKSIAFEGVAWMINILGTSLVKNQGTEAVPIMIDVLFYSLFIGAEVFRAKSAVGPIVYGKRAKEHMKKEAVKVNIFPIIPASGGAGFACQVTF